MFSSDQLNIFTIYLANIFSSDSVNMFTSDLANLFISNSANLFTSDLANIFTSGLEKWKNVIWLTSSLMKLTAEHVGLMPETQHLIQSSTASFKKNALKTSNIEQLK